MPERSFEIGNLNRQQRRFMGTAKPLPASACKVTRWGEKVALGLEQPGFVVMTDAEAIELANALLGLARRP